ncbi:hypothetical protein [Leptospira yasudae]|uniref:hypothetical protein n=1 Tax=Leptospira yasudae TaxID=2202201 RepID=UPI001FED584B|nr:hypothetical protein [Leptospira yasudae]
MKSFKNDYLKDNLIRSYIDTKAIEETNARISNDNVLQNQINSKVNSNEKGAASGLATLGVDGLLSSSQRPQILASEITQDSTHRLITDSERTGWNGAMTPNWNSIQSKPSSFAPSAHDHNSYYYTKTEIDSSLSLKRGAGPIAASEITQDSLNRFVTDSEKATWNSSSSNIKLPKYSGDWSGKILPVIQKSVGIADPDIGWKISFGGSFPGSNAFFGGVLLPDGRVFCVPSNITTARIFDPVTNTVSTPSVSFPGGGAFIGGALLADGRVFCIPYSSTSARIYNPVTDSIVTPTGVYPGTSAFWGGVLLRDGRVFCVPFSSTTARIYNPTNDTLITPTGTYPGNLSFAGAVLLSDGRVFCVPHSSTSARIYNPTNDTLTTPAGLYPGNQAYMGGVLLQDGRVFCVPYNATSAKIYDPVTDTLSTPNGIYPGGSAFSGGVLLSDGRVFCVPTSSTTARIYDPMTDTLVTPTGTYPGGYAYTGGVLLFDGRVFCVPTSATVASGLGTTRGMNTNFPVPLLLSAYLNKL